MRRGERTAAHLACDAEAAALTPLEGLPDHDLVEAPGVCAQAHQLERQRRSSGTRGSQKPAVLMTCTPPSSAACSVSMAWVSDGPGPKAPAAFGGVREAHAERGEIDR